MAADETVRTAVVVVHGMGEQRPMEVLDRFVKTALHPRTAEGGKRWDYYPLPGTYICYDALTAFWARTHGLLAGPLTWQDLREQGNPWRITDFVTVGAPMALADHLLTRPALVSGFKKSDAVRRRELFEGLVRRGVVVRCPPRSETLPVDSNVDSNDVLASHLPFRRHTLDESLVSGGSRRAARRLVRRRAAPVVRSWHPRY